MQRNCEIEKYVVKNQQVHHSAYKTIFLIIKMLFFSIMINAAKNKCSDVSIFKGKARNVDYMSSCKLRVLEKKVLFLKNFVQV